MRTPSQAERAGLLLALVGLLGGCAGAPSPSPSVAPAPSVAPDPTVAPASSPSAAAASSDVPTLPFGGALEPGAHRVTTPFPVTFDLTVEDDWGVYAVDDCCVLLEHDHHVAPGLVLFNAWTIDAVYSDPCRGVLGSTVGSGVVALVAAFRAVPALGASEPTDVTIDGRPATHLTLELDPSACENHKFSMWAFEGEETRYVPPGYKDVVDELWILEVDGTRIVLDGSLSEATGADRAELDAIVKSVRFP